VIKSKAPVTCKEYGDRYCLMGPWSQKTANMEVEAQDPPTPALAHVLQLIRSSGIHVVAGKWLIPGAPYVILFDIGSAWNRLNEWKADLWNIAGVPSPENDQEMNQAVIFGYLVAWFLGEVDDVDLVCIMPGTTRVASRFRSRRNSSIGTTTRYSCCHCSFP
jgi:glycogen(starch) synthase